MQDEYSKFRETVLQYKYPEECIAYAFFIKKSNDCMYISDEGEMFDYLLKECWKLASGYASSIESFECGMVETNLQYINKDIFTIAWRLYFYIIKNYNKAPKIKDIIKGMILGKELKCSAIAEKEFQYRLCNHCSTFVITEISPPESFMKFQDQIRKDKDYSFDPFLEKSHDTLGYLSMLPVELIALIFENIEYEEWFKLPMYASRGWCALLNHSKILRAVTNKEDFKLFDSSNPFTVTRWESMPQFLSPEIRLKILLNHLTTYIYTLFTYEAPPFLINLTKDQILVIFKKLSGKCLSRGLIKFATLLCLDDIYKDNKELFSTLGFVVNKRQEGKLLIFELSASMNKQYVKDYTRWVLGGLSRIEL